MTIKNTTWCGNIICTVVMYVSWWDNNIDTINVPLDQSHQVEEIGGAHDHMMDTINFKRAIRLVWKSLGLEMVL